MLLSSKCCDNILFSLSNFFLFSLQESLDNTSCLKDNDWNDSLFPSSKAVRCSSSASVVSKSIKQKKSGTFYCMK
jgi:hypothetical protein